MTDDAREHDVNEPESTEAIDGREGDGVATLTDEEIETRTLAESPQPSLDDNGDDSADVGDDAGDDSGDDAEDDSGDDSDDSSV